MEETTTNMEKLIEQKIPEKRRKKIDNAKEEPRILRGPPTKEPNVTISITDAFLAQAEKYPVNVFQIDPLSEKTETYAEARLRVVRLALYLEEGNILKPDECALVVSDNTIDNIIPILATICVGGVASSIDPKGSKEELVEALVLLRPSVVFCEPLYKDMVKEVADTVSEENGFKVYLINWKSGDLTHGLPKMNDFLLEKESEKNYKPYPRKCLETAIYVFTSGTTSLPKPVALSHFAVMNGFKSLYCEIDNCKPHVLIHFASLYWISAILLTGLTIHCAGTKVVAPTVAPLNLLEVIDKYKVTFAFMSNTYTYGLTKLSADVLEKYNTSSLYSIIIGGSIVNPNQLLKLRQILPHTKVTVGYGSTECSGVSAFDLVNVDAYNTKLQSAGKVLPNVQVKIVDPETGILCPPNKSGEILVKSPYTIHAYHHSIKPTFEDHCDADGFFKTGDLGYYDDEEYLYVTDRLNDMFKYQTYQISPLAIELVLLSHPAVEEAAAFNIPHEVDRNHPAAVVVLKPQASATENEIREFANNKLPEKYKIRGPLWIRPFILKTGTGKVRKSKLREMFVKEYHLEYYGAPEIVN